MILAELTCGVSERFECLRNCDVLRLQAKGGAREPDFGQASPQRCLSGDKARSSGSATLFCIIVGEHRAFARKAVDVRRLVAHQAVRVGADIRLSDVVAKYYENAGREKSSNSPVIVRT